MFRLDDILRNAARERPADAALFFEDSRWSFAELDARVSRLAAGLQAVAEPGDRVAVWSENLPAVVEAYDAEPRAGMVLVLLEVAKAELRARLA